MTFKCVSQPRPFYDSKCDEIREVIRDSSWTVLRKSKWWASTLLHKKVNTRAVTPTCKKESGSCCLQCCRRGNGGALTIRKRVVESMKWILGHSLYDRHSVNNKHLFVLIFGSLFVLYYQESFMTGIFSLAFIATRGLAASKPVPRCFLFCLSLLANLFELANSDSVMHYTYGALEWFHVLAVSPQKVWLIHSDNMLPKEKLNQWDLITCMGLI